MDIKYVLFDLNTSTYLAKDEHGVLILTKDWKNAIHLNSSEHCESYLGTTNPLRANIRDLSKSWTSRRFYELF